MAPRTAAPSMAYGTPAEPKRVAAAPLVELVGAELVVDDVRLPVADAGEVVDEPIVVELPPVETVEVWDTDWDLLWVGV